MVHQIGAMIIGLLAVSFAAVYGLNGLQSDLGMALGGYRELREIYDVGLNVATAKKSVLTDKPDIARAANELDAALAKLDRYLAGPGEARSQTVEGARLEMALRSNLREALASVNLPPDDAFHPEGNRFSSIDHALGSVAAIGAEIQKTISDRQAAARRKWHATLTVVMGVSIAVVLGAVVLGIYQYRSVISPLQRLGDAARKITAGHFTDRLALDGPAEFRALASDFNRMAGELDALYRDLAEKVAVKSKELAQSERLASVGYLAAGVAHEINNPLSIITGYGERAIQHIQLGEGESMLAAVEKSLRVMCEEAYRCKTITDQLLSLARSSQEARKPVSLLSIAKQVEAAAGGIAEFKDRKVVIEIASADQGLAILASEGELKQVLLNLLVNGLEAVEPRTGEVRIHIERDASLRTIDGCR